MMGASLNNKDKDKIQFNNNNNNSRSNEIYKDNKSDYSRSNNQKLEKSEKKFEIHKEDKSHPKGIKFILNIYLIIFL